jgi:hypothetical protein
MRFVYTGPSWAASSYPIGIESTNLAKEWRLQHTNCAIPASTVLTCIDAVKLTPTSLPLVWVYNEPLGCLKEATGLTKAQLIQRSDWKDIWEECNQFCLKKIASLNRPVLLIGGHSDIVNCEYSNITVGIASWQKFLAKSANMTIEDQAVHVKMDDGSDFKVQHCWGAEVTHRFMHENSDIKPSIEITNAVWDIFFFWKELEKSNLFHDVHPNKRGNELFASFLKPTIVKFLEENQ